MFDRYVIHINIALWPLFNGHLILMTSLQMDSIMNQEKLFTPHANNRMAYSFYNQLNDLCLAITQARYVVSRGDVIATISVHTDSYIVSMTSANAY